MKDAQSAPEYGRTNWRRFAVAVGVPTAVAAGLLVALQTGALAANFSVAGTQFKLSADRLEGEGFTQYSAGLNDNKIPAAMSGIESADLYNLCQSVRSDAFGFPIVLRIAAAEDAKYKGGDVGADPNSVHGDNLLIGMSELSGDATFTNIEIGHDAGSLDKAQPEAKGAPGTFGQQADHVSITGLRQRAYSTSASTFRLKGMSLKLIVNDAKAECYAG